MIAQVQALGTGRKRRIDIWSLFNYNLTENKTMHRNNGRETLWLQNRWEEHNKRVFFFCVCVCVCGKEWKRRREKVRERDRERERERERERCIWTEGFSKIWNRPMVRFLRR